MTTEHIEIPPLDEAISRLRDSIAWLRDGEPHKNGIGVADMIALEAALSDRGEMEEALRDMLSGWVYIRQTHGDLYGVGWDRAQGKAEAALAGLRARPASEPVEVARLAEDEEFEAFDAHWSRPGYAIDLTRKPSYDSSGCYVNSMTDAMFSSWLARATLASRPASEAPAGWREALQFYADGGHRTTLTNIPRRAGFDWDVEREKLNAAGYSMVCENYNGSEDFVEDGTVAAEALAAIPPSAEAPNAAQGDEPRDVVGEASERRAPSSDDFALLIRSFDQRGFRVPDSPAELLRSAANIMIEDGVIIVHMRHRAALTPSPAPSAAPQEADALQEALQKIVHEYETGYGDAQAFANYARAALSQ